MSTESNSPTKFDTSVLIVGGGGAGLTCSMLLSQLNIDNLLVSAFPTTSILPKAHVLNQRTMEILTDCGVADEIAAKSTPAENMSAMGWYAGLAGDDPDFGRLVGKLETWGVGYTNLNWVQASACRSYNLPQIRLEPIFKKRAETLNPAGVHFHHELIALEQDDEGATATIKNRDTDEEYQVRARYVLGCDGGRTLPRMLDIPYEGLGVIGQVATAHVSADLSKFARDPDVLIRWIWCPAIGEMAVLVPMGPDHWGPDSEEWVFHVTYAGDNMRELTDAQIEQNMRLALGIGDLPMTIHKITRWTQEGVIGSTFRKGRVFLVGDAAHRHPPTGGLGLTSGIQDAYNICWKIAAVLNDQAGAELLDTYEAERRPVDARNVERSLQNAMAHLGVGQAFGIDPAVSAEDNWKQFKRVWSGLPEDAEHRSNALRAIRNISMEANELNVEYGYRYSSSAIICDGTLPTPQIEDIRLYQPDARPGSPLPHAWIDDEDGNRCAMKDLVSPGRFLLIAGEDGEDWCAAARSLSERNDLPLDSVRIGHLDGDLFDTRLAWTQFRGIEPTGAVLVRPDRVIGWRSLGGSPDPISALGSSIGAILGHDLQEC